MENILIVGAHFDDAELGAGGTAAKLIKDGKKVYKLTLTDNVTSFQQKGIDVEYESAKSQSHNAASIIGMEEITDFKPLECSKLMYSKEIMQRVESIIYDLKIDTLFTHFGTDMNQDHVEASRICVTAGRHCANILQFQSNGYILDNVFYPTFFIDISDVIDVKKKALSQYSQEHNRFNRLFETNIERNHIWGYGNEIEYAEGFNIVKYLEK